MKDKLYHEVVGEKFIASWQDLTKIQKPIIAAVNGYAVRHSFPPFFCSGLGD
jgi:enoyl-CoA hydratase/carnithine racemase